MEENKLGAYIGFARRAGKLTVGVNAVKALRGKVYLLLLDSGASENTKKETESLKSRFSCPLVVVENLESLTGKPMCKLAAMQEEHLARAALGVAEKGL